MKAVTLQRGIRFHYIRDRRAKHITTLKNGRSSRGVPIACVVSQVDRENNCIWFGCSVVNPKFDTFDYFEAKDWASRRFIMNPSRIELGDNKNPPGRDVTKVIMTHIVNSDKNAYPGRVRKWAKSWVTYLNRRDAASEIRTAHTVLKAHGIETQSATSLTQDEMESAKRFGVKFSHFISSIPKALDTEPILEKENGPGKLVPRWP